MHVSSATSTMKQAYQNTRSIGVHSIDFPLAHTMGSVMLKLFHFCYIPPRLLQLMLCDMTFFGIASLTMRESRFFGIASLTIRQSYDCPRASGATLDYMGKNKPLWNWTKQNSGAAPTGDAPTTPEWSTILLPNKVGLILEVWLRVFYPNKRIRPHCN